MNATIYFGGRPEASGLSASLAGAGGLTRVQFPGAFSRRGFGVVVKTTGGAWGSAGATPHAAS